MSVRDRLLVVCSKVGFVQGAEVGIRHTSRSVEVRPKSIRLVSSLGNGLILLFRRRLLNRLVLGNSGESLLLDFWRSRASTVLVDGLLGLGGSLLCVALDSLHGFSSMLVGKALDLLSLLVGNVVALLQLSINDILVLDVDEGTEEGNDGRDQSQAPERNKLDKEVGEEGCEEGLGRISQSTCTVQWHREPLGADLPQR